MKMTTGLGSLVALAALAGCVTTGEGDVALRWIAEMDAKPPSERVPNWDVIRAMMMREVPEVGDVAPEFALETDDGGMTVHLAELRRDTPVVLVFGSWT